MSSDTDKYAATYAISNEPYFSREGTMWIGLSRTGYMVTRDGANWYMTYTAWGQEPEVLDTFSTREEAEAFGILTFKLQGG